MKKLLVLSVLFILAGCIDVGDFGKYWSKTTLDPDVKGTWSKIPDGKNDDNEEAGLCHVRQIRGAYEIRCDDKDNKNKKPDYPVKTLAFGPYYFFALKGQGKSGGEIFRYDVGDNVLTIYNLKAPAAMALITKNYPGAQVSEIHLSDSENSSYISVRKIDPATAEALANIPNDDTYWQVAAQFEKVKKK